MTLREIENQRSVLESRPSKLVNRPSRLRATPALRAMVRETELNARDFIYPLFVRHGSGSGARSARCRACINCRWQKLFVKRKPPWNWVLPL